MYRIIGVLFLVLTSYLAASKSATAQGRKPVRVRPPSFKPDAMNDVFVTDPASTLQGVMPSSQAVLAATTPGNKPAGNGEPKEADKDGLAWSKVIAPTSIEDLNQIAKTICPPGTNDPQAFGYLPDSRRLWAWGYVFGGDFYDKKTGQVLLNEPHVAAAIKWMAQYASWYGADTINRFRQGDQSLPGKTFPLLPIEDDKMIGRYSVLMDGQWRVRDINAFANRRQEQGIDSPEFGVCPLPTTCPSA